MDKLSVLCTVYNESNFLDYSISSYIDQVDHVVCVEGSYLENIKLGASPRSTDGTLDIIRKYLDKYPEKFFHIEANEQSDTQQRNVGLNKIRELNPDNFFMIIDGDEVYDTNTLKMVRTCANTMEKQRKLAAYFKSLTFINNFKTYTEQDFPRLFKMTPGVKFVNDNFTVWEDLGISWFSPYVIRVPYVKYYHYSFCKGRERFLQKRNWWMNRGLSKDFDYGWKVDESGEISDVNHEIYEYTGTHPLAVVNHPLWKMAYGGK